MKANETKPKKLPKLYRPVTIGFCSLRNQLGPRWGVIFDCDEYVRRHAMRVGLLEGGWKWQLVGLTENRYYDPTYETDQEICDEHAEGLEVDILWPTKK